MLVASGTEILWQASFESQYFFWQHRVSISSGLNSSSCATTHQKKIGDRSNWARSAILGTTIYISRNYRFTKQTQNMSRNSRFTEQTQKNADAYGQDEAFAVLRCKIPHVIIAYNLEQNDHQEPYSCPYLRQFIEFVKIKEIHGAHIPIVFKDREIWCQNCCMYTTSLYPC